MQKIIVFLGPTLSLEQARAILPHGLYHAPAECGDILRVMRLNPEGIVIIDGYYEQRAALWHKEILCALDAGIWVIGASSMGALRASELTHFGMMGVGRIYEDFFHGRLTDDDEVAVIHAPREMGFAPLNEAMVNIRYTLANAMHAGIITPAQQISLIAAAKNMPYPYRSIRNACQTLTDDFSTLFAWVASGHYLDQKALDAQHVLEYVSTQSPLAPTTREPMEKTIFIRNLLAYANTTAFNEGYDYLPENEKMLTQLQVDHPHRYAMHQKLANLLAIVYELAINVPADETVDTSAGLFADELGHYVHDPYLLTIYQWIHHSLKDQKEIALQVEPFIRWTRLLFRKAYGSLEGFQHFVFQYAVLWLCLDVLSTRLELCIHEDDVQTKTTLFMQAQEIDSMESLEAFVAGVLTLDELNTMLLTLAYLQVLFEDRSYDFLLPKKEVTVINWLQRSLKN